MLPASASSSIPTAVCRFHFVLGPSSSSVSILSPSSSCSSTYHHQYQHYHNVTFYSGTRFSLEYQSSQALLPTPSGPEKKVRMDLGFQFKVFFSHFPDKCLHEIDAGFEFEVLFYHFPDKRSSRDNLSRKFSSVIFLITFCIKKY